MTARSRTYVARYAVLTIASLIIAIDYRTFVEWGGLYPAGVTGLSMLLQRIAQHVADSVGWAVTIPFSPINLVLNAVPVWIGFRYIGRNLTLQSLAVIFLTGLFTDILPTDTLMSFMPAQELARIKSDPFVTSVFGGIVFGFAMALCLRWNTTTGGTDFIAIYLSERKGRETWNLILAFNASILLAGGFEFGWTGSLYSIVYQFISLQVLHLMYRTYQYQTLFIVTKNAPRICEAIYRFTHHGATVMDAKGAYKGEPRSMVMSVVAADETPHIYTLCKSIDPDAFINTVSTSRIIGRFYLRPRD